MGKNKNQKKHGITSVHVKKFVYVGKIHIINVIYQTIWWEKQQKHGITTVRKIFCICGKKKLLPMYVKKIWFTLLYVGGKSWYYNCTWKYVIYLRKNNNNINKNMLLPLYMLKNMVLPLYTKCIIDLSIYWKTKTTKNMVIIWYSNTF